MAAPSSTTVPSCNAPRIGTGLEALDSCSAWLEQAHGILNVLLDVHCHTSESRELTHDQVCALYAADTLMEWARAALADGHGAALKARPVAG